MRIVAIGGGEIGKPGYPVETTEIDEQIVRLTGKTKPRVLFIPTASGDSEVYCETFQQHFGGRLGCKTDVLRMIGARPGDERQAAKAILSSDAVYVGGGNTAKMMRVWRRWGIDKVLKEAAERGIVLSGLSAGAICWFRFGNSDSKKFANPSAGLVRVRGLGLVRATLCPHYNAQEDRRPSMLEMIARYKGIAIALDDCCAIEIMDDHYRILASKPGAQARRLCWGGGGVREEFLEQDSQPRPIGPLLGKGQEGQR